MKYKTTKTISLIMVIILLLGAFAGCSNALNGDKETTPSANAGKENGEIGVTELTDEQKENILEIYQVEYNLKKEDILSAEFFGETTGAFPVIVKTNLDNSTICEVVGGLDFVYRQTQPLHIVYGDQCYRLNDAYEKGIIDDNILRYLFWELKNVCNADIDDRFEDNKVVLLTMPSYNAKEYTINDFAEINCTKIKDLGSEGVEYLDRVLILTLAEKSKENVLKAVHILNERVDIYIAEPNFIETLDLEPDDFWFNDVGQWGCYKTDLLSAWDLTTGSSSITVGIIDTGIDASHPELSSNINIELSKSFIYNEVPGMSVDELEAAGLKDQVGHGTGIAGIIGAVGDNTDGIAGICWNVQLISLKVATYTGEVDKNGHPIVDIDEEAVIEAIDYAKSIGIDILNYSAGGNSYSQLAQVREVKIESYNGLFVCAAGNDSSDNDNTPYYPSNHNLPNLISVGASTKSDKKRLTSNYGDETVDIFAPGEDIWTTSTNALGYTFMDGTSFAAPHVAGVAALMLSIDPYLTPAQLKQIIMNNVDIVYDEDGNNVFESLCVSGGRLNAFNAVETVWDMHSFDLVSDGAFTHSVICSDCGLVFSTESHTFICKYPNSRHTVVCQQCRYLPPRYIVYMNQGVGVGHTFNCAICGRTGTEAHEWKATSGSYSCTYCSATSSYVPEIMSLPPEFVALIQEKGLSGDFVLMLDEDAALCCIDGIYYCVAATNEEEALALINSDLTVIKPGVETE